MSQYFQKGTDVRVATTAADEVALRFKGFAPVAVTALVEVDTFAGVGYRDLQATAKELGIPANQSAQELIDAIDLADAESTDNESEEA